MSKTHKCVVVVAAIFALVGNGCSSGPDDKNRIPTWQQEDGVNVKNVPPRGGDGGPKSPLETTTGQSAKAAASKPEAEFNEIATQINNAMNHQVVIKIYKDEVVENPMWGSHPSTSFIQAGVMVDRGHHQFVGRKPGEFYEPQQFHAADHSWRKDAELQNKFREALVGITSIFYWRLQQLAADQNVPTSVCKQADDLVARVEIQWNSSSVDSTAEPLSLPRSKDLSQKRRDAETEAPISSVTPAESQSKSTSDLRAQQLKEAVHKRRAEQARLEFQQQTTLNPRTPLVPFELPEEYRQGLKGQSSLNPAHSVRVSPSLKMPEHNSVAAPTLPKPQDSRKEEVERANAETEARRVQEENQRRIKREREEAEVRRVQKENERARSEARRVQEENKRAKAEARRVKEETKRAEAQAKAEARRQKEVERAEAEALRLQEIEDAQDKAHRSEEIALAKKETLRIQNLKAEEAERKLLEFQQQKERQDQEQRDLERKQQQEQDRLQQQTNAATVEVPVSSPPTPTQDSLDENQDLFENLPDREEERMRSPSQNDLATHVRTEHTSESQQHEGLEGDRAEVDESNTDNILIDASAKVKPRLPSVVVPDVSSKVHPVESLKPTKSTTPTTHPVSTEASHEEVSSTETVAEELPPAVHSGGRSSGCNDDNPSDSGDGGDSGDSGDGDDTACKGVTCGAGKTCVNGKCVKVPKIDLCVFDVDLTLTSHGCPAVLDAAPEWTTCAPEGSGKPSDQHSPSGGQYQCGCNPGLNTYGWYNNCMGVGASDVLQACVDAGAHIGIATHSPLVSEQVFENATKFKMLKDLPGLKNLPEADGVDKFSNWGQNNSQHAFISCPGQDKGTAVHSIMQFYKLPATANVLFFDDGQPNIDAVTAYAQGNSMPNVVAKKVARVTGQEVKETSGCGVTVQNFDDAVKSLQGSTPPAPPAPVGGEISVMTFNINRQNQPGAGPSHAGAAANWQNIKNAIFENGDYKQGLKDAQDIAFIQEADPATFPSTTLRRHFDVGQGYETDSYGEYNLFWTKSVNEGQATLVKKSLLATGDTTVATGDLLTGGRPFTLIINQNICLLNVHAGHDSGPPSDPGAAHHLKQAEDYVRDHHPDADKLVRQKSMCSKFILGGDHNSGYITYDNLSIFGHQLHGHTNDDRTPIDHILSTGTLVAGSQKVQDSNICSDHLWLKATFQFQGSTPPAPTPPAPTPPAPTPPAPTPPAPTPTPPAPVGGEISVMTYNTQWNIQQRGAIAADKRTWDNLRNFIFEDPEDYSKGLKGGQDIFFGQEAVDYSGGVRSTFPQDVDYGDYHLFWEKWGREGQATIVKKSLFARPIGQQTTFLGNLPGGERPFTLIIDENICLLNLHAGHGYTGAEILQQVQKITPLEVAREAGSKCSRLILGGDHNGDYVDDQGKSTYDNLSIFDLQLHGHTESVATCCLSGPYKYDHILSTGTIKPGSQQVQDSYEWFVDGKKNHAADHLWVKAIFEF